MSHSSGWPDDATARQLHADLLTHTATATEAFTLAFLRPLADDLLAARRAAPELCEEAAERTILSLLHSPSLYNPERGTSVVAFVRMAARRDLLNLQQAEARHQRRRVPLESVELAADDRNSDQEDDGPTWADPRLQAEIAAFGPAERTTFRLLCAGVRDTRAFALALGLVQTGAALAAAVKRHKDVVKARLRRAVEGER